MLRLIKTIPFIVQVILVIVVVSAFALVDPTGLLSSRKLTLKNTPVSIKSVRSIGKLISAEYYGETLASLQEAETQTLEASIDTFFDESAALNTAFIEAVKVMYENKREFTWPTAGLQISNYYHEQYASVIEHYNYPDYLDFMIKTANSKWPNQKFKSERDLLKFLVKGNSDANINTCQSFLSTVLYKNEFKSEAKKQLTADKKFRKKQMVMIGRGVVVAGMDFGEFKEDHFQYNEESRTIYLMGMTPVIIDTIMNPWFIPSLEIRGFEILYSSRQARDFDSVTRLKKQLKQQLIDQAIDRDILAIAKTNAEENLKAFFSLVMDQEIKRVVILENSPQQYMEMILGDNQVTDDELSLIDSVLCRVYDGTPVSVKPVFDSLNTFKRKNGVSFSRFTGLYASIVEDSILDLYDQQRLSQIKSEIGNGLLTKLDSIWLWPQDTELATIEKKAVEANAFAGDKSGLEYLKLKMDSVRKADNYLATLANRQMYLGNGVNNLLSTKKKSAYQELIRQLEAFNFHHMITNEGSVVADSVLDKQLEVFQFSD
jgi:hypothetical protein